MTKKIFFLILLQLFAFSAQSAVKDTHAFSFYLENDTRDLGGPGSDNAYSSGMRFSYVIAAAQTPKWADLLVQAPQIFDPGFKSLYSNFGISFGQQIYTPNDIRESQLIVNDRPYAAWMYVGFMAHFKSHARSQVFELDIGIVGPEAQGEKFQNELHRIIGKYYAEGWRNQIATEPTLQIAFQQREKFIEFFSAAEKRYFDVIPYFGGGLGNVSTDAHIGGLVRGGLNIPEDFGPKKASSTEGDSFVEPHRDQSLSLYAFIGGRGMGVLRNIFLDGNTFKSSHRVKKIPFVIETEIGFAAEWRNWNYAWRFVTRSPEFTERSVTNSFASISVSTIF